MKKTGIVGLVLAFVAIVLCVLAFVPMTPLEKYNANFYSPMNIVFGVCSAVVAVIALIVSIVGTKKNAARGAGIAGIVLSAIMIAGGLAGAGTAAVLSQITDYLNEKPGNAISQTMSEQERQELDKTLQQLLGPKVK